MAIPHFLRQIYAFRNTLWIVLPPLLLLPIPIVLPGTESACGYTICLMAIYWITEAIPLAVTGFIPLIIFPMTGIMTGSEVSQSYFKDTTFLFIGGLIIAICVEVTGLHKRIALRVLLIVGAKPHCLMLGFMLTTFFLSMWISNTATTAMMLPIVEAVFNELKADDDRKHHKKSDEDEEKGHQTTSFAAYDNSTINLQDEGQNANGTKSSDKSEEVSDQLQLQLNEQLNDELVETEAARSKRLDDLIKGITICVPYAASIGGTATLTGTAPNLVLAGQFEIIFPDATQSVSFGSWLAYSLPGSLVLLGLAYIWLMLYFLGFRNLGKGCLCGANTAAEKNAAQVIKQEYEKLGSIRWGEVTVLTVFILTALLWFFREPGFMPGWAIIFPDEHVTDGTVAMTMAFLLFILPGERPSFLAEKPDSSLSDTSSNSEADRKFIYKPVSPVIGWPLLQKKFPWDIVFLIAGGFALADGSTASGFSEWMGQQLAFLDYLEPWAICLVVTIIVCLFTECSSNTATASLFVPILANLAQVIEIHPLYLMIPPVIASSLAFMLPVATPPNAIAFSYGHLKVIDLVKAGWMLNVIGIAVVSVFINTYGMTFWELTEFPDWAAINTATTAVSFIANSTAL